MARSFNRIELIGNLTHDPDSRVTPKGTPVCSFGLATNREWKGEDGAKKEEAAFHRIVAWKMLAEQCGKFLRKGSRAFVAGRLSYRAYEKDGTTVVVAEIVIDEMILLDAKPPEKAQTRGTPPEPQPVSADELTQEDPS